MEPNRGWIKVYRKIQSSDGYGDEKFCRNAAWIDLLLLANHSVKRIRKRGIFLEVPRGCVGYSEQSLAEKWHWSRGKVRRYLKELETEQQIKKIKNNVTTLISIVNYELYQGSSEDIEESGTPNDTTNGTDSGTGTRMIKNVKNSSSSIGKKANEKKLKGNPQQGQDAAPPKILKLDPEMQLTDAEKDEIAKLVQVTLHKQITHTEIEDYFTYFKIKNAGKEYQNSDTPQKHFSNSINYFIEQDTQRSNRKANAQQQHEESGNVRVAAHGRGSGFVKGKSVTNAGTARFEALRAYVGGDSDEGTTGETD